jgi:hypothetical protein
VEPFAPRSAESFRTPSPPLSVNARGFIQCDATSSAVQMTTVCGRIRQRIRGCFPPAIVHRLRLFCELGTGPAAENVVLYRPVTPAKRPHFRRWKLRRAGASRSERPSVICRQSLSPGILVLLRRKIVSLVAALFVTPETIRPHSEGTIRSKQSTRLGRKASSAGHPSRGHPRHEVLHILSNDTGTAADKEGEGEITCEFLSPR